MIDQVMNSDFKRLAASKMGQSLGQKMWPMGSKYIAMPHSVAIEASGWFDAFQSFLDMAPPIANSINGVIENPLVSVMASIAKPLNEMLSESGFLRSITTALGMPGPQLEAASAIYGAHLAFKARKGAVIEETAALHEMLLNADIAADLPGKFFAPPYSACYVHLEKGLALPLEDGVRGVECDLVGAYVLCHDGKAHLGRDGNPMQGEVLDYITAERWGIQEGCSFKKLEFLVVMHEKCLDGGVNRRYIGTEFVISTDSDTPLLEVIRRRRSETSGTDWLANALMVGVEHLAKVFLYMGLSDIRKTEIRERSEAEKQLQALGPKKRAKAERQMQAKYDRIVIGPVAILKVEESVREDGSRYVKPHMRRGHFRMQRYGQGNQLLKMVFIAPVLVRADLASGWGHPKQYTVC